MSFKSLNELTNLDYSNFYGKLSIGYNKEDYSKQKMYESFNCIICFNFFEHKYETIKFEDSWICYECSRMINPPGLALGYFTNLISDFNKHIESVAHEKQNVIDLINFIVCDSKKQQQKEKNKLEVDDKDEIFVNMDNILVVHI